MHGVSHKFMVSAFELYGFAPFTPVSEQEKPDPEFPTVKFPNPEEKGIPYLLNQTYERTTNSNSRILGALVSLFVHRAGSGNQ